MPETTSAPARRQRKTRQGVVTSDKMTKTVVVLLTRRTANSANEVLNEAPLVWLFVLGALCVAATLVYYATITPGGTPGQTYTPPRMKNGKIEPGQLK